MLKNCVRVLFIFVLLGGCPIGGLFAASLLNNKASRPNSKSQQPDWSTDVHAPSLTPPSFQLAQTRRPLAQTHRQLAQARKQVLLERPVIFSDDKGQSQFVSYRDRRSPWGFHVGVMYSFYAPVNYEVEVISQPEDPFVFAEPRWRLFEALAAVRWNSALGSLALEARGGLFRSSRPIQVDNSPAPVVPQGTQLAAVLSRPLQGNGGGDGDTGGDNGGGGVTPPTTPTPTPTPTPPAVPPAAGEPELSLMLIMASLGAKWSLDSLTREPWLVPFVSAGAFMFFYIEKESLGSKNVEGRSPLGFYYSGGVLLQLDWLDKDASVDFYLDSGIENTFLTCEVRQFIEINPSPLDKNFTGPIHFNIGLVVEF